MNDFGRGRRGRRTVAYVSQLGTTQIHARNPATIACWSLAFPGFGHLLLDKYLRGYALILWEMFINQKIHLNLAIVHSFNGQFQAAKDALDPKFMFLYIPVYLFSIWDSYRTAADLNKQYILAAREQAPIKRFSIGAMDIHYLDKRKPWIAAVWSMTIPSLGQMYLNRIILSTFILVNTILIIWKSNLILALHYLLIGAIAKSSAAVDIQWLLYFPSFYFFTIYDAYVHTVESNKLFDASLKRYLIRNYQPTGVKLEIGSRLMPCRS